MIVFRHVPHWAMGLGIPVAMSTVLSCSTYTIPAPEGTGPTTTAGGGGSTTGGWGFGFAGTGGGDAGPEADVASFDAAADAADVGLDAMVDVADADSAVTVVLPPTACIPSVPPTEICNDKDDDCNGLIDEGCPRGPVWTTGMIRTPLGDSTGGDAFSDSCAGDEVLVGLRVAAGAFVTQVRGVCRKYVVKPAPNGDLAGVGMTMGATRELTPHPTSTTDPIRDLVCPEPKIFVGFRLSQQNDYFGGNRAVVTTSISGICADPALKSSTARLEWQTTSEIGPVAGTFASIQDWIVNDQITSPSVLVGVSGFSGSWIDKVGTISSTYGMTWCTGVYPSGPDPMNRVNWLGTASNTSQNPADAIANAYDANGMSRWATGKPQSGGEWFKLDLGAMGCIGQVTVTSPGSDFPARYSLSVSTDDKTYVPVAAGVGQNTMPIAFPSRDTRYIRIDQVGMSWAWWSITDITVQK